MLPDAANLNALFPRNFPGFGGPRESEECNEIDKNHTFPLPDFLEHLDEGQKDKFLSDREGLFECPISLEPIVTPAYIQGEQGSYSSEALFKWFRASRSSPLTRQPLTQEMILDGFSPRSYVQYQELVEETRKLVRSDLLGTAPALFLEAEPGDAEPLLMQDFSHLVGYLILEQHNLLSVANVQSLLNNPLLFLENYQKLVTLKLNQTVYLELLLKSTVSAQSFFDNMGLFLHSLELDVEKYRKRIADSPEELALVKILLEPGLGVAIDGYQAQGDEGKAGIFASLKRCEPRSAKHEVSRPR
ncbi:hypothetical protein A0O36_02840 [Piscirickettsiaceae bacterium NZ-RLO1]|nr:hypothetical protein A0O36_02840 [Piscirickettsiaceae bacterium NZ-RLO1]